MAIIKLDNVRKVYPLGKTEVEAVKGASFSLEKGDFVSITGPSGSGKSTILNMIGLIDTPTQGKIQIDGIDIYDGRYESKDIDGSLQSKKHQKMLDKERRLGTLPPKFDNRITELRRIKLGIIFQNFNLIPVLNVYENIEFPLLLGKNLLSPNEKKEWIDFLIEKVGLSEWKNHKSNELSGGQRQRVAIARALVTKAPVILADEPTANLDSKTGDQILQLMKDINREMQTTFIFSTHDPKVTKMADHVIRLLDGEIIENYKTNEEKKPVSMKEEMEASAVAELIENGEA